jgi:hydrogenase/urease accessory protein HupE
MCSLVALVFASAAHAHDFNPGVLALHELDAGTWDVAWTAPVDSRGTAANVDVTFPAGCTRRERTLTCVDALAGPIAFLGLHDPAMQVIVSLHTRDGTREEHLVVGASPSVTVGARSESGATLWVRVGIEHILFGPDHVAFVLGLLLVLRAGFTKRLLATLTAFTIAHSITLALAMLDVVRLPRAPVEACIALSVLLVAREALRERETLLRRAPWLVAGIFGLVHGLGFAGALTELGVPPDALGSTLVLFNVGIELGQVAIVIVALVLVRAVPQRARVAVRVIACTALGACGAWWLIDRVIDLSR